MRRERGFNQTLVHCAVPPLLINNVYQIQKTSRLGLNTVTQENHGGNPAVQQHRMKCIEEIIRLTVTR